MQYQNTNGVNGVDKKPPPRAAAVNVQNQQHDEESWDLDGNGEKN